MNRYGQLYKYAYLKKSEMPIANLSIGFTNLKPWYCGSES